MRALVQTEQEAWARERAAVASRKDRRGTPRGHLIATGVGAALAFLVILLERSL